MTTTTTTITTCDRCGQDYKWDGHEPPSQLVEFWPAQATSYGRNPYRRLDVCLDCLTPVELETLETNAKQTHEELPF